MSLKLQVRQVGNTAVLQCEGPIISGSDIECLEAKVTSALVETKDLVLDVSEVSRVDSCGLGLLVRLLMRARKAGGDLKLACPPAFVTNLLEVTRLSAIFQVFRSQHEAVMSSRTPASLVSKLTTPKTRIVFLDRSYDLCAFVRTVLTGHGYEVLSATLLADAKILLKAERTDFLMLGPNRGDFTASLQTLAPNATVIELDQQFQALEAERASTALLQLLRANNNASTSEAVQIPNK